MRFCLSLAQVSLFAVTKISNSHLTRGISRKCNESRDPSPRLSARTTQLSRNVAASRWRLCPISPAQETNPRPSTSIALSSTATPTCRFVIHWFVSFAAIDKFDYEPNFGTKFGGVTAIRGEHYRYVNGHSNQYWGWGGEDNNMEKR